MGTETMTYLSTFKKKSFRFRPISKTKREFAPIPVRERMMISPAKRKEVGGLRARRLLLYYVFSSLDVEMTSIKKKDEKKASVLFSPPFSHFSLFFGFEIIFDGTSDDETCLGHECETFATRTGFEGNFFRWHPKVFLVEG